MDIRKVKKLIELLEESGIDELEIHEGEESVRISRHSKQVAMQQPIYAQAPAAPAPAPAAAAAPAADAAPAAPKLNGNVVRSPMVGTFYIAPTPDTPPYVTVGKQVNEGDVLCIIEAMKLMNEIKSEVKGRIAEVLVENGQPIEFDQPLFKIQKS